MCNVTQVVRGSEVLEVLHSRPDAREYLMSLYECRYAEFFQSLGLSLLINSTNLTMNTA